MLPINGFRENKALWAGIHIPPGPNWSGIDKTFVVESPVFVLGSLTLSTSFFFSHFLNFSNQWRIFFIFEPVVTKSADCPDRTDTFLCTARWFCCPMLLLRRILFDITSTNSKIYISTGVFKRSISGLYWLRNGPWIPGLLTYLETPIIVTIPPTETNNNSGGASFIIMVVAIQNCKIDRNPFQSWKIKVETDLQEFCL